jgi:hypothetical protein
MRALLHVLVMSMVASVTTLSLNVSPPRRGLAFATIWWWRTARISEASEIGVTRSSWTLGPLRATGRSGTGPFTSHAERCPDAIV